MITIKEDTNLVSLRGELEDNLEFSHEIFGEKRLNSKLSFSSPLKLTKLVSSFIVIIFSPP